LREHILLKGTYYHYCEIDQRTVDVLLGAESMGQYFNTNIGARPTF
jgi:KTSC domain